MINRTRKSRDAQQVPAVAARLLVEGTARSFSDAKQKAAALLGVSRLPDNRAVLAALIDYQRLFEGPALSARNSRLRDAARRAMRAFAMFEPRLTGPVLYGTALHSSPVSLHLFADEVESVTRCLLQQRIPYQLDTRELRFSARDFANTPVFRLARDENDFEFVAMPRQRLNQAPLSPLDGLPYQRVTVAQLDLMFAADPGGVWITAVGRLNHALHSLR